MKLVSAQVRKFRNIDDSGPVPIQDDVTALVGKNESGKTAFLQALDRLKSVRDHTFVERDDYPRWLLAQDRRAGTIAETSPVKATFELEKEDLDVLAERFGEGTVRAKTVTIGRRYNGMYTVDQDTLPDEGKAVGAVRAAVNLPVSMAEALANLATFAELEKALQRLEKPGADGSGPAPEVTTAVTGLRAAREKMWGKGGDFHAAVRSVLLERMPSFFYFDEYALMGGRTDLQKVLRLDEGQLNDAERTARALLHLAEADDEALFDEDYEGRKAELEAVSNDLTAEMAEYWTQSTDLQVQIDVDKQTENTPNGQTAVARHLEIRVYDRRHGHSGNLDRRSNGFRWFFSFLAAFSEYQDRQDRIVILLDEPALSLHARAQKDFLRFVDERLAPNHQVIFTTHSPFMVEPTKLERARLVEDKGARVGSKVSADVMAIDKDTLFPLQAALGYDIAQSLFIAPHNLLLEGTSDFTYLTALSEHLKSEGRVGLDERWALLPVGSVTKITTFLALLGQHLDVTVLVDGGGENKAVADLVRKGQLDSARFITPAQVTGTKDADIEDLFSVAEYLGLYNAAVAGPALAESELTGTDRILKRIERARAPFNHGTPAEHLLRHRNEVLAALSDETLGRFEELFKKINATLPPV